ncbi:MAG: FAD-binding protein [Sutterella seckii]
MVGVKATDAAGSTVKTYLEGGDSRFGRLRRRPSMLPPKMKDYLFYGVDGETGDGFKMATKIGAGTINLDLVKMYPQGVETRPHHGLAATASSTDTMKKSGAMYVNRDGKRFVDENAGLGVLTDKTIEQPGSIAYIVMDAAAWKQYVAKSLEDKLVPDAASLDQWTKIVNNGRPVMAVSNSLEDAAKTMGIDPKGLEAQVAHWNEMVKAGADKDFNRRITGGLGVGPYHIVEQKVRYRRRSAASRPTAA